MAQSRPRRVEPDSECGSEQASHWQAAAKFNTCHYIPNTCQYIPIHTMIHARYIPILDRFSTRVFAPPAPAYKCWYVLVCIGMYCASICQLFGMYYVMVPVNTSKYTYQYVQYKNGLCNDTSQYQQIYIPICTIQAIFSIPTNISEYVQILAIHSIHTNAYQYRSVLSNTYQYRHIQTNTYQYLQYILLLTNTYNTDQYIPYIPMLTIHPIQLNTDQ